MTQRRVIVVGAGLAGLAAAVAAQRAGADVLVLERRDEPGGATVDSAGWIWRYRDLPTARTCASHAEPAVLAAVVERLDDDLRWLESHGVRALATGTGRAITTGMRVDPRQAVAALTDALGEERLQVRTSVLDARHGDTGGIELRTRRARLGELADAPDEWLAADAIVFAGGGYAADLDRVAHECGAPGGVREQWVLRARNGGDGSSMDAAIALGALRVPADGESLVRIAPPVTVDADARTLVRFSELHLPQSRLLRADGTVVERAAHDWSGAQAAWQLARSSGGGRLELAPSDLRQEVHAGSIEDIVRAAIDAGVPAGREDGRLWLDVAGGFTHTLCGLRVDADGRLLHVVRSGMLRRRERPEPMTSAWAAGADAAGTGLGGTASGLAQALVLGRRAGTLAANV